MGGFYLPTPLAYASGISIYRTTFQEFDICKPKIIILTCLITEVVPDVAGDLLS